MKYAVYTVTRNLYEKVVPSVKSLLANSDVDKVYLLIEDDKFPVELPSSVECMNVSTQKYFRRMGPNMVYPWAYMSMMRAALYKVLPDVDVVLSLDVDTIIESDISELWGLPLDDYYFAAVPEPARSTDAQDYYNTGVMLLNLAKMRDGKGDAILNALNWQRYEILEQDCLNEQCKGQILAIPSTYNACQFTSMVQKPKVVHYAGVHDWFGMPLVQGYNNMPFGEKRPTKRSRKTRLAEIE